MAPTPLWHRHPPSHWHFYIHAFFQRHPPPKVSTLPQSWLTVFWPCKDHLHSCLQQVAV